MKREFTDAVCCPGCGASDMSFEVVEEDAVEIRDGRLICQGCRSSFEIAGGIVKMLDEPDAVVVDEVKGWHELAGPLDESLVATMLQLPSYPHPPWAHVAPDFFQVFDTVDLSGARVVDIGAGRTWSSRYLKLLGGASEVVAVDILATRFLGLETADIYFAHDRVHFERMLADFHRIPLRDGWADVVFSCASVHHSSNLDRAFHEFARVLRPGGQLILVSEPSKRSAITATRPENEETAVGINEHIYAYSEYSRALKGAGFRFRRMAPRSVTRRTLFQDDELLAGLPLVMRRVVRTPRGRRMLLAALRSAAISRVLYHFASLPLSLIAWKRS
jgi:ubiquinone/menaquinone biosynthesis C-methylase UbiE/uncharacterized protein YbaR (Trm112 family)